MHRLADPSLASLYGVVELDRSDRVVGMQEKPEHPRSDLVSTATYLFSREHLAVLDRYLDEGNAPDPPGAFLAWLCEREPVYGFRFSEAWLDIGDPEQLLEADNRYRCGGWAARARGVRAVTEEQPDTLVFIPAWNEEQNLPAVLEELRGELPAVDVLVVDDGSTDGTAKVARENGALVLSFGVNRGLRAGIAAGYAVCARARVRLLRPGRCRRPASGRGAAAAARSSSLG